MAVGAKKAVLNVSGMRDNACRERVLAALARVRGVKDVSVSLIRARAVIVYDAPCATAELVRAVKSAGYGALLHHAYDAA